MMLLKRIFCCLLMMLLSACSYWHQTLAYIPWLSTKASLPLQVTDNGVGPINSTTVLERRHLINALEDYQLPNEQSQWRYGMKMHAGQLQTFYQLLDNQQLAMAVYGQNEHVNQVIVYSSSIKSQWGVQIGMVFHDLYHQAIGYCAWYDAANLEENQQVAAQQIVCRAPQSAHVYYVFTGKWSGPKSLLPDNQALANWLLNKIIWREASLVLDE